MAALAAADETLMRRALELAERGRGFVEPNPMVGAVIVRNGKIIGEGWHQRFGEAHAEVNAIAAAGEAARGATLYVTLEPCCHHGKTPPCTDAIIHAGIKRVVAAISDPFPQVAWRGAEQLRTAGTEVVFGVCEAEAVELNAPYLKLLRTGRPYVIAKWAMSLDGKIATATGDSRWISGEESRRRVHQLRGRMDAIIVGIGTVLADDPLLTARPPGPRVSARVILDRRLRLPLQSQLVRTAAEAKIVVVHSTNASAEARRALEKAGCECLGVSGTPAEASISLLLEELGRRRWTNVLVEGGSEVLGSFLAEKQIDEVYAFIAPKLIGGENAPCPIGGRGILQLADALLVRDWKMEVLGGDVLLQGRIAQAP